MIRMGGHPQDPRPRIPRESGDDPGERVNLRPGLVYSPRERG